MDKKITIQHLYSNTNGNKPTALADGEIAINQADKKLYISDGEDVVALGDEFVTLDTDQSINGGKTFRQLSFTNGDDYISNPELKAYYYHSKDSQDILTLSLTAKNLTYNTSELVGIDGNVLLHRDISQTSGISTNNLMSQKAITDYVNSKLGEVGGGTDNVVTLDTEQTITGEKTFGKKVTVNNNTYEPTVTLSSNSNWPTIKSFYSSNYIELGLVGGNSSVTPGVIFRTNTEEDFKRFLTTDDGNGSGVGVTIDTNQSITGKKTFKELSFTNGEKYNGNPVLTAYYNHSNESTSVLSLSFNDSSIIYYADKLPKGSSKVLLDEDIEQTSGDSEGKLMSQKAITEYVNSKLAEGGGGSIDKIVCGTY